MKDTLFLSRYHSHLDACNLSQQSFCSFIELKIYHFVKCKNKLCYHIKSLEKVRRYTGGKE